jgi:hypothetical protein
VGVFKTGRSARSVSVGRDGKDEGVEGIGLFPEQAFRVINKK